jgi:hypothetical protein
MEIMPASVTPENEHGDRPKHDGIKVPESGPLPDTARTVSMLAGAATIGAVIGGPIGGVVGGAVGLALGLGATGHLPARG